jgi:hypothetical protein
MFKDQRDIELVLQLLAGYVRIAYNRNTSCRFLIRTWWHRDEQISASSNDD